MLTISLQIDITEADTDIEAIQLINGIENVNMGRLELLYNGTWGTVCDRFWSYSDAKVACRFVLNIILIIQQKVNSLWISIQCTLISD